MHECDLRLWIVAAENLVIVLDKTIWNRLAVERCSFIALCNNRDVVDTLLVYLDFLPRLIVVACFYQERS